MNPVEIEEALSHLALQPFDAAEFPFAFLAAFGNKDTALKRLRTGHNNTSDIPNGVLQRSNIHLAVCAAETVGDTLRALRASPATAKAKAKFALATDGQTLEAEDLNSGEILACAYPDFADHFGFFLPLAGISTVKEIKDNPVDVRATGRLNKLYVELLNENPDWAGDDRRADMNHFMARLVFCFFAEDTDIFNGDGLFTKTIAQMSAADGSNTHEVMAEIFRAMNIPIAARQSGLPSAPPPLRPWADQFPYVNGGLFSGSTDVPRFTRMARTYLTHAGNLNWKHINPDIFGSMIQAVADDAERGALGMHYTSVPNILKVLNPLFLDDLRGQLAEAGNNERKLLNLRRRMARIRVFDPACGSGNFLVIAYKQLRALEAEINTRRGESHLGSEIPLTNFRGIELRDFPAEIARLALIIAEFQCDVLYRGQKDALAEFLPLNAENWIVCGNALRLDWLSVCPPTGTGVRLVADDLFGSPLVQAEIDFANEGGETFICGNPPYLGSTWQSAEQKDDLKAIFDYRCKSWKSLDYVAGWFMKAADYGTHTPTTAAFVSTNSICQGQQVPILWPMIFASGHEITFAYTSFKWANLASYNAGVTVVIVGIAKNNQQVKSLFSLDVGRALARQPAEAALPEDVVQVRLKPDLPMSVTGQDVGRALAQRPAEAALPEDVVQVRLKPDLPMLVTGQEVGRALAQRPAEAALPEDVVQVRLKPDLPMLVTGQEVGRALARQPAEITLQKEVAHINAYLVPGANVVVEKASRPLSGQAEMTKGNQPTDGGHLLLTHDELAALRLSPAQQSRFIRRIYGSAEFIRGLSRYCLWIEDGHLDEALKIEGIAHRIEGVRKMRLASPKAATIETAKASHQFGEIRQTGVETVVIVPRVSSESRSYLPVGLLSAQGAIVADSAFALYDAPLWNMALIASRLHLVWIATVCGKLKTDFRYSNTLGWNTFPVPTLTAQNKADLTACAEDILVAREVHFPATNSDLYDPENMPENLRQAHERNDEVLERIYIGRRFKNDTERLEKLFALYTKMTATPAAPATPAKKIRRSKQA